MTDRARGALLGLAAGDALGTTLEFSAPPACFAALLDGPHREMTGGGPFHVAPGQVTDDSHMACCLAASLVALRRFDAADVARRYVAWRAVTFDIGATTSAAVALLAQGHLDAGRPVWEASGRRGAANGSLMRVAPLGVFFWNDATARRDAVFADARLTHYDPRCQLACAAMTRVIASAIAGTLADPFAEAAAELDEAGALLAARDAILAPLVPAAAADLHEDLRLAREQDPRLDAWIHRSMGFVRVAFRLAFWELAHAPTFAAALIDVVNRGGDSDTNGAIAGMLLGAVHGAAAIPAAWSERVLVALQDGPPGPFRDAYHPKTLLTLLVRPGRGSRR